MKKMIILVLLVFVVAVVSIFAAEDWSQYESGRDNIRLDGYNSQPGYIAFADGAGTVRGYMFTSTDYNLYYVTTGKITLKDTRLNSAAVSPYATRITTVPNP